MSDQVKHECAVTLLRLRREPEYYLRKYGSSSYALQKMSLLLEKQHNRGQDGAGIGCVKLNQTPGAPACRVEKAAGSNPLAELLGFLAKAKNEAGPAGEPWRGELMLGHLRYGTFGGGGCDACHPFMAANAFLNRTLLLAGNFNLTDTGVLFERLLRSGHHPVSRADGALILGLIEHWLDRQLSSGCSGAEEIWPEVLRKSAGSFDGAFTLCGITGDGSAFALRDPAGIRPGYYYVDDEVAVVASERPAIQTAFNLPLTAVKELPPGEALVIDRGGNVSLQPCLEPRPLRRCVFERIYFSRGNDADIYQERLALGRSLWPEIRKRLSVEANVEEGQEGKVDFSSVLFSYIPNTALISFYGLLQEAGGFPGGGELRFGQVAVKDAKFRTFITDSAARKEFSQHVYDITYGLVRPGSDTLVILDDSIVRGNTMCNAILPILDRLEPVRIIVVSAAPPICYPDCYGIDMASLQELVAFESALDVLRRTSRMELLLKCYNAAKTDLANPGAPPVNHLKELYAVITPEELAEAIAARITPPGMKAKVEVIFQSCPALRKCCPEHTGDWYFTGDYPTPGGVRVANRALVNYVEKIDSRAY